MKYSINYSIHSINYCEADRTTRVVIVNEDTGELFTGTARRNPADRMDIALATNLATLRAVRKAVLIDLIDCKSVIINDGAEFSFNC